MTATTPAVYIDAQTREELTPRCEWLRGVGTGAARVIQARCDSPAAFVWRPVFPCGCPKAYLRCTAHARPTNPNGYYCATCERNSQPILAQSVEPL